MKKAVNGEEREHVEAGEEEAIEVEHKPFFFTLAPGLYQQNRWGKILNHKSAIE